MLSTVASATTLGINACFVRIEVDVTAGLPQMALVGLPDQAVKESKERVKAAIKNSGFPFPSKKIIVNLAPADLKKEGPAFDLPIAVGILSSLGYVQSEACQKFVLIGELALDGSLRRVRGVLPIASLLKNTGLKPLTPLKGRKRW